MTGDAKDPLVTVICPTYNSRATLQYALRSVLNQDFADFEVRVMGDACTDGTEEVIKQLNDPRLHWFNLAENSGHQFAPNNEGLRRARGKYVAFIGHDDLWFPWHLSRLVAHLEQTGADFAHDLVASAGTNGIEGVYGAPHAGAGYARIYFPASSWLHRRELREEVGFWKNPKDLAWASDYDFTRRAAEAGKKFVFLPSLGVLKFHSRAWAFYSRTAEPPQKNPLDSILENPAQLHEKILTELAAQYAQCSQWNEKKPLRLALSETKLAAKDALKAGLRELTYLYGHDRWPLGPLLRRRMRRIRSRQRTERGLPPLTGDGL